MNHKRWSYAVHPGVQMTHGIISKLKEKTGRSLDEWITLAQSGPADEKKRVAWLKEKHGLGTNYAGWISERSFGRGMELTDPEAYLKAAQGYVDEMFAGPRAALRPLYDRLLELVFAVGPDIGVSPGKTIVPIYRHHVIAQIKPATRTRIDLGLALGDTPATNRLLDTGGLAKGDRITHRIALTDLSEIDAEVEKRLKQAYARDA